MVAPTLADARRFRTRPRQSFGGEFGTATAPDAALGLRPDRMTRQTGMRKTLSVAGSVVVSSLLGWAGSRYGIMTGFMLATIGTGLGMYCGRRLADRLGA